MKNPIAQALGRLAAGHKKTMSKAALAQRKHAARRPRPREIIAKALPMPAEQINPN